MAGGLTQSSSSSGIFFQGDGESQGLINSHLSSSYGNSTNSGPVSGPGYNNLSVVSGEMNNAVLNSVSTSGPSVGASSLVTDANSALSGGPQLQRSASINAESYMRLPASPMSFSSNNISISGSSVVDGSTVVQQSSQQDPSVQQGGSSATSLPTPQNGQVPLSMGPRVSGPFFHDPNNITQAQKKPRMDIKQDDVLQQQVLRQWLQRQDVLQLQQSQNPQFQLLLQQQRLRQQQQLLQSLPPLQRAQLQQQQQQQQQQHQQQLQMRQQLQPQGMQQQVSGVKRPYESSVCARRLMQYLYHQRQRPSDNNIIYWRKFVAEYYSPRAKKRWCLSLYDSVGHHALGVFPQMAVDAWQCDICGSKSGRGFEATFEVLPRLNEIKFASGVLDELLFLDVPRECRFPSGIMMLEFGKAVQESVYEHLRVVREGQLRIIFSQELKILSWEFCARCHEEFLPRRLVAPQVNQLLQVAQKCQSTISESGSDGVSQQDLQANSNMVLTAGRQLAKSLELHSLNDLGFSKRYVRCLQISEVVNSMKDLIDFCRDQRIGPIEGLKSYPRHMSTAKLQMQKMQEMEQLANARGLPTDRNSLNKLMAMHNPGMNIPMNANNTHHNHMGGGRGALGGSAQATFALTNYQTMLMRQNSMSSNPSSSTIQQQPLSCSSSSFVIANPSPSPTFQGSSPLVPVSAQNPSISGLSSSHLSLQRRALSSSSSLLQPSHQQHSGGTNQALQQQMIQQLLQQMSNSNGGAGQQQQSLSGHNMNFNINNGRSGMGSAQNTPVATPIASTSNSFKAVSNNESSSAADSNTTTNNNGFNPSQNLHHSQEGMVPNICHEFSDNGFFSGDLDDNMGYILGRHD